MNRYVEVSSLLGKTLDKVERVGNDELIFHTTDGEVYKLYHEQECCEDVSIEDINGDLEDLIGTPITMAEASSNNVENNFDSETWTFYKFATVKGYVTVRWYGTSNGYYSEGVDFIIVSKEV